MIRLCIWIICALAVLVAAAVASLSFYDTKAKYQLSTDGLDIPSYVPVELDFHHQYEAKKGLPYGAGAIIDIDNDGADELFLGGGLRQSDKLFVFLDDHFINVENQVNLVKQGDVLTLGATVIDFDANGYQDLIISRESGIWLYRNEGGQFSLEKIDVVLPDGAVPLSVSVADLNRDGFIDFFVPMISRTSLLDWLMLSVPDGGPSARLFINNGDNSFSDITESVGMQQMDGAIQSLFADLDDDGLEDLIVLHANGLLSTYKNRGNLLFENKPGYHTNLDGNYMGLGHGDFNGDGRLDLFLSNSGSTIPRVVTELLQSQRSHKYSKWILLNNVGFFSFRDEAPRVKLADHELARGALFTDVNGDGMNDLIVSQNHPYWLPYQLEAFRQKGKLLLQNSEGDFVDITEQSGINNNNFSVAPLTADFNNDGAQDIVFVNVGGSSKVYLGEPVNNNFLKVKLADTARSLGAVVEIKTLSGKMVRKRFGTGAVLCSDSTHTLVFGLKNDKATDVVVTYADGKIDQTSGVLLNTTISFAR